MCNIINFEEYKIKKGLLKEVSKNEDFPYFNKYKNALKNMTKEDLEELEKLLEDDD